MLKKLDHGVCSVIISLLTLVVYWTLSASNFPTLAPSPNDQLELIKQAGRNKGLFHTKEEVDIWRSRIKNGPYKSRGDAGMNKTPGDYSRILENAKKFLKDPKSERWKGPEGNNCVKKGAKPVPYKQGVRLRDAAFVYLLTGDNRYSELVKRELLAQAGQKSTDFSNRFRWCNHKLRDLSPSFYICEWLSRLILAYDYTKDTFKSTERKKMENWFLNAALFFQKNIDSDMNRLFVDRQNGDYTPSSLAKKGGPGSDAGITHYQGHRVYSTNRWYNNRRSSQVRFYGLAGVLLDNRPLIKSAKNFVKEWITFAVFSDGLTGEFNRGTPSRPEAGWFYSMYTLTHCLTIADALARTGDTDLYEFKTSEGMWGTEGGNKSLLKVMTTMCNLLDDTFYDSKNKRQGIYVAKKGNKFDEYHKINGRTGNLIWTFDSWLAQSNLYYRDPYIKATYLREKTSEYRYDNKKIASIGPHRPWGGVWDLFPGKLFMFGQLEKIVWPYPVPQSFCAPRGTPCDDLDPNTSNDVMDGNCQCAGTSLVPANSKDIHINVGGPKVTASGITWIADRYNTGGRTYKKSRSVKNTKDDQLFHSERYGNFSFDIPVTNGSYTVDLLFAEIFFLGSKFGIGKRVFDVMIEGKTVLRNFDINKEASSVKEPKALKKSFKTHVNDRILNIDFRSIVNNAKVSAISIIENTNTVSGRTSQETNENAADNIVSKVYPNPADNSIFLDVSDMSKVQDIYLINSIGQVQRPKYYKTTDNIELNVVQLRSDYYTLIVAGEGQVLFQKKIAVID